MSIPQNSVALRIEKQSQNPLPESYARKIPIPKFYPTERTSTSSFKAPVTLPKKKEEPPPPPPGALTTAMNYISSPVKYISSIFSSAPAPQPEVVQVKERQFKIDIEKREKEQQSPPKRTQSQKKIQNVITEELVSPPKPPQQPEKNQGSTWRRRNMMEVVHPPPSPKPARSQSPKKMVTATAPSSDSSPAHVSQLKIASSSNYKNSFKVVSKNPRPPEEPEKKKKKEVRKFSNNRLVKDTPAAVNMNKPLSKQTLAATKLNVPTSKDEYPIVPYPTVLPPRIPPATYTIRSAATKVFEDVNRSKEHSLSRNHDSSTERASLELDDMPVVGRQLPYCPDLNIELEETLGHADSEKAIRVSRLDQLPANDFGRVGGQSSLRKLFPDTTLVGYSEEDTLFGVARNNGQPDKLDVVLCSSSGRRISPEYVPHHKMSDSSLRKKTEAKRGGSKDARSPNKNKKQSASPRGRSMSPTLIRSEPKDPNPPVNAVTESTDVIPKDQKQEPMKPIFKPEPPKRPNYSPKFKETPAKYFPPKKTKTNSPPSSRQLSPRRPSPLKVDIKYKPAIANSLGKDSRALKMTKFENSSPARERSLSKERSNLSDTNIPKPRIIKKSMSVSRDNTPERSASSTGKSAAAMAAASAAAAAAVTAVSSAIQQSTQEKTQENKPEDTEPARPRSPSPFGRFKKAITTPSTNQDLAKAQDEVTGDQAPESPKSNKHNMFKNFVKEKFSLPEKVKKMRPLSGRKTVDTTANVNEECDEYNCIENYCGDPSKFCKAATMMGEIP